MSSPRLYPEYHCTRNAPLSCDRPWQTIQEYKGAKFCVDCGFPATLMAGQEIRGRRGTYQVKQFLGARGYGRLYAGVRSGDGQPIVIKEYLLPERHFNPTEAKRRQEVFEQLAGLTPADGRVQDFRLEQPLEAISARHSEGASRDPRCYLITAEKLPTPTLRQFLAAQGAMPPQQVREVLNQALQTLQFLHTQKFRRPSGQVEKGTVHGNLNLDSLLISGKASQFYIYLCDLASWEFLFDPALSMQGVQVKPGEDLENLGRIGFDLWHGQETEPTTEYDASLYNNQPWMRSDPLLREFLLRLMGFGTPFESAEAARLALLQLPQSGQEAEEARVDKRESLSRRKTRYWWMLAGALLLLLLGGIGLFLLRSSPTNRENYAEFKRLREKFTDVIGIPKGRYLYTSEAGATWTTVLPLEKVNGRKLENLLIQPNVNQQVFFEHRGISSKGLLQDSAIPSAAVESVRQQQAQFAITTLPVNPSPSDPYSADPIAYDGILVYVPFSLQGENLPKSLEGRITLADLRQIFTGQLKNWSQIGGLDRSIEVRVPTDPEAVYWFKKQVLQDDPQLVAQFNQFVAQKYQITSKTLQDSQNIFDTGGPGIISFGILSSVWDQCRGYPLAIADDQGSVQPLKRNATNQPITPSDPICDKANHLDVQLFASQRYLLGYSLTVVYPRGDVRPGGEKFALLLKTQQGQCAVSKVGLVPLQPVPQSCTPP
ncbi:substrate-binding domain-containing protein [Phormidium tenue FACHB-886]|nr:substrate-binding domain-containing protein [Phormidium tenue FACHB-886]